MLGPGEPAQEVPTGVAASIHESQGSQITVQAGSSILEASNVSQYFGALVVLDGVDFRVGGGEAVGVVGPNGAGKTTLLNVLAGSFRPSAGTIRFRGQDVTRLRADRRCRLGIARSYQVPRPFGGMTVFENALVSTGGSGPGEQERALEVLEQCGLIALANRRADALGLLQRKRLELARALATNPAILLLDEIGGGLTDAEAADLLATIRAVRRRQVAIVWIEHIVHVLLQAIDRLVCIDAGRVIADGDPRTVIADAAVIDAYLGTQGT